MAASTIDAGVCERLVTTAINHCNQAPQVLSTPPPAAQAGPNFDALATSFGALSNALTWGTLVFAVVSLVAGIAWGYVVKMVAEREAREEAERCAKRTADELMKAWLVSEAPQLVRTHVENLVDTSLGEEDQEVAAEEIGKEAG